MNNPEPLDEGKPVPETRGGDRPADYIKGSPGVPYSPGEEEEYEVPGGNDPDAQ